MRQANRCHQTVLSGRAGYDLPGLPAQLLDLGRNGAVDAIAASTDKAPVTRSRAADRAHATTRDA
jgi:hypothetical protein